MTYKEGDFDSENMMVPQMVKEELLISREPALPWPHGEDRNQNPLSASVWAGETGGGSGVGQRGVLGREGHWVNSLPLPTPGLLLGVPDGDFQHQLWRDLEELRVVAVSLEQERQDIKAASWGFPALLYADLQAKPPGQTTEPQALQRQQR